MIAPWQGHVTVASDKSLSHRALLFSALAEGESVIHNVLAGEDVLRTLKILNQLGVQTNPLADEILNSKALESPPSLTVTIKGVGLYGLQPTSEILYCGNSGTTMRLMLGLLSSQKFSSALTGDASLNKRPMVRVMEPLQKAGAEFRVEEKNGKRIITCVGRTLENPVKAVEHKSSVASAQVKSALFLSGLYASEPTLVTEPSLSRNHTELLFKHMGVNVTTDFDASGVTIRLHPAKKLTPLHFTVPSDISSAAFFIIGATLIPKSHIRLLNVSVNPTRTGILDVLKNMGASLECTNTREECGELVSDLVVKYAHLLGTTVSGALIPRLIDEIPILALAGLMAQGEFVVRDAKELKVKETDRIHAIVSNLQKLSTDVLAYEDGFKIQGLKSRDVFQLQNTHQITWQTFGDHRIAMMGVIVNAVLGTQFSIDDTDCIRTSFPQFFEVLQQLKGCEF